MVDFTEEAGVRVLEVPVGQSPLLPLCPIVGCFVFHSFGCVFSLSYFMFNFDLVTLA